MQDRFINRRGLGTLPDTAFGQGQQGDGRYEHDPGRHKEKGSVLKPPAFIIAPQAIVKKSADPYAGDASDAAGTGQFSGCRSVGDRSAQWEMSVCS